MISFTVHQTDSLDQCDNPLLNSKIRFFVSGMPVSLVRRPIQRNGDLRAGLPLDARDVDSRVREPIPRRRFARRCADAISPHGLPHRPMARARAETSLAENAN